MTPAGSDGPPEGAVRLHGQVPQRAAAGEVVGLLILQQAFVEPLGPLGDGEGHRAVLRRRVRDEELCHPLVFARPDVVRECLLEQAGRQLVRQGVDERIPGFHDNIAEARAVPGASATEPSRSPGSPGWGST